MMAKVMPVLGQPSSTPFSVEVVHIPVAGFLNRWGGLPGIRDVLNVVALSAAYEAANPFGPECRHDAGGSASPIVAAKESGSD
jgi:hypothetical protein